MPVLSVARDRLLHLIGNGVSFTEEEFDSICANMGLELDEVTSERDRKRAEFMSAGRKGIDTKELEAKLKAFSDAILYKIDVPANRWDLLCAEGFAAAVRTFLGYDVPTTLTITPPRLTIDVSSSVGAVRPYIAAAVLRNCTLDDAAVASFIDHQEKLHGNVCRKRRLVSVGTHRMKGLVGPFKYEALDAAAGNETTFTPLNQTGTTTVTGLPAFIRGNEGMRHLVDYLPPVGSTAPMLVLRDANNVVMSVPPIINGDFSKVIATHTDEAGQGEGARDILIEATCEDLARAHVVVAQLVTAFGRYCDPPMHVEPVTVRYQDCHPDLSIVQLLSKSSHAVAEGRTGPLLVVSPEAQAAYATASSTVDVSPSILPRLFTVTPTWMSRLVGADVPPADQIEALKRLNVHATLRVADGTLVARAAAGGLATGAGGSGAEGAIVVGDEVLDVSVPCSRPDVLHAVDLVEDVAIGHGYDKVAAAAELPPQTTGGYQQPLNHLADLVRMEAAACGWVEALTFSLLSMRHATYAMRWSGPLPEAATGAGGCTVDSSAIPMIPGYPCPIITSGKENFAAVRQSLVPPLLLALHANKAQPLPQRMFEVSDCVLRDPAGDNGARNVRRVSAVYTSASGSGYEVVKGLLDVLLAKLLFAQRTATGSAASAQLEGRDSVGGMVPAERVGTDDGKGPVITFVADDSNPAFFPRRAARILRFGQPIGWVGIVHPEVRPCFVVL